MLSFNQTNLFEPINISIDSLKAHITCLYEKSSTAQEQPSISESEASDLKVYFSFVALGHKRKVEFFPHGDNGSNYALDVYITENDEGFAHFHLTHLGYTQRFQPSTPLKLALIDALNKGKRYKVTNTQRLNRCVLLADQFKSKADRRSWVYTQDRLRKAQVPKTL